MKIGDLIVPKNIEGQLKCDRHIRIAVGFGKKEYRYFCAEDGVERAVVYFLNGGWGWKSNWQTIKVYESKHSEVKR